jgi:tetratricopeptide (TPR) repeat protein
MEILKKMIPVIFLGIVAMHLAAQQSQENLEKAFGQSYELEKKSNFKGAATELLKVYTEDSYEINLRLGWLYYNAKMYEEAIKYYSKANEHKPYSEEAKFGMILPLAAQTKWNEVITLYEKILEINPNNTTALYRLGYIWYERKEYNKSHQFFKKVVDLYPFGYDGLLMLGWTSYFTGNYNQAKILFNKVKLYNPGDKSANEGLKLLK